MRSLDAAREVGLRVMVIGVVINWVVYLNEYAGATIAPPRDKEPWLHGITLTGLSLDRRVEISSFPLTSFILY
jgi:hypothetical protein